MTILRALQTFAEAVTAKMNQLAAGEPEEQVCGPSEDFMSDVASALDMRFLCTGETPLPNRLGRRKSSVDLNRALEPRQAIVEGVREQEQVHRVVEGVDVKQNVSNLQ